MESFFEAISNNNKCKRTIGRYGNRFDWRFYTIHNNRNHHFEIHVEALDYPAKIIIEPDDTRLDYVDSNITTKISISAFNYEGTSIDLNNVTLKIEGKNAKFDNNNTIKTINISKDSVTKQQNYNWSNRVGYNCNFKLKNKL